MCIRDSLAGDIPAGRNDRRFCLGIDGLKLGKQRKRRRGDLENPERRRRRLKQAKMLLMAGEGKAIFSLRPGSVSYTHLDVYKRQL